MSQRIYVENEPKIEYSQSLRRAISLRESPKYYVKARYPNSNSKYETSNSFEFVSANNAPIDDTDYYYRRSPLKRLNRDDKSWKVLATSLPKSYADLHREKRGISSRSSSRMSTVRETPLQSASKFKLPKEQTISEESIVVKPPSGFKLPPAPPGAVYAPFIVPYYLDSSGKPVIASQNQLLPEEQALIQHQLQQPIQQPIQQPLQQQLTQNATEYSTSQPKVQDIPQQVQNENVEPKNAEIIQVVNETSNITKRVETQPSQIQILKKESSKMGQKEPSNLRVITTADKTPNQQRAHQRPYIINEMYPAIKEIELDNRVYVPISKVPYYERSYKKKVVVKKTLTREDQINNLKKAETKGFRTYFDKVTL